MHGSNLQDVLAKAGHLPQNKISTSTQERATLFNRHSISKQSSTHVRGDHGIEGAPDEIIQIKFIDNKSWHRTEGVCSKVRRPSNSKIYVDPYRKYYPPSTRRRRLSLRAQTITYSAIIEEVYHIYFEHGKRISYDKLIMGEHKERWLTSSANEFGRLMQGVGLHSRKITDCVQGTDTMRIIRKHQLPKGKAVTYGNFVCDYRLL